MLADTLRPALGRLNRRLDLEAWYPDAPRLGDATLATGYRARNASVVAAMIAPAIEAGWDIRLWALDEVAAELAAWTEGQGPGSRFHLVNRLAKCRPVAPRSYFLVADDDVSFERRDIVDFVGLAHLAGADVAQPAHAPSSMYSWRFTLSAARTVVRSTSFVEIGPIFLLSPRARKRTLPLPEEGMGWGVEFQWSRLRDEGAVLAIVDAVTVRHHGLVAAGYDLHSELAAVAERARQAGYTDISDLQVEHRRWRAWRRRPPRWVARPTRSPG
jgi:hypothetical protein